MCLSISHATNAYWITKSPRVISLEQNTACWTYLSYTFNFFMFKSEKIETDLNLKMSRTLDYLQTIIKLIQSKQPNWLWLWSPHLIWVISNWFPCMTITTNIVQTNYFWKLSITLLRPHWWNTTCTRKLSVTVKLIKGEPLENDFSVFWIQLTRKHSNVNKNILNVKTSTDQSCKLWEYVWCWTENIPHPCHDQCNVIITQSAAGYLGCSDGATCVIFIHPSCTTCSLKFTFQFLNKMQTFLILV